MCCCDCIYPPCYLRVNHFHLSAKGVPVISNARAESGIVNPETGLYLELDLYLPSLNLAFEYNVSVSLDSHVPPSLTYTALLKVSYIMEINIIRSCIITYQHSLIHYKNINGGTN